MFHRHRKVNTSKNQCLFITPHHPSIPFVFLVSEVVTTIFSVAQARNCDTISIPNLFLSPTVNKSTTNLFTDSSTLTSSLEFVQSFLHFYCPCFIWSHYCVFLDQCKLPSNRSFCFYPEILIENSLIVSLPVPKTLQSHSIKSNIEMMCRAYHILGPTFLFSLTYCHSSPL